MKISQNEARKLKRRVEELEQQQRYQRRTWQREYPGGVHLGHWQAGKDHFNGVLWGASRTGHALVVTVNDQGRVDFYALPQP